MCLTQKSNKCMKEWDEVTAEFFQMYQKAKMKQDGTKATWMYNTDVLNDTAFPALNTMLLFYSKIKTPNFIC